MFKGVSQCSPAVGMFYFGLFNPFHCSPLLGKYLFFVCVVLEFELRAYTLSHSINPFSVKGFFETVSRTKILLISAF
jgi:hypothetical protein